MYTRTQNQQMLCHILHHYITTVHTRYGITDCIPWIVFITIHTVLLVSHHDQGGSDLKLKMFSDYKPIIGINRSVAGRQENEYMLVPI